MTLADDFISEDSLEGGSEYPQAFGITFTPVVLGIALGICGILGAGYIYMNMVAPAQKSYREIITQKQEKQTQLNQLKTEDKSKIIEDLNRQIERQQNLEDQVLTLFANETSLDTLLLDINSVITANQGKLENYQPGGEASVISDSSLGENVNGKLKRQSISLQVVGSFEEIQSILRDLERLQPLLLVSNYNSQVSQKPQAYLSLSEGELIPTEEAQLKINLNLNAIVPTRQIEENQPEPEQ